MNEHMSEASEALKRVLNNVVSDAESLIETLGEEGSEKYRSAIKRLQRNIRYARDELGDFEDSMMRRARLAVRNANQAAHEHPWEVAGTAVAVGAVVGILIALSLLERR